MFSFSVGTTHCQSKSQRSSLCLLTLITACPTEEPGLWLGGVLDLISLHRHPGVCLPLSRSPALLEGASIPLAVDVSGFSSTWPRSALLGKLSPLSCEQLYISSGLAPGLAVWNTVFMLVSSFFTASKACCFTTQKPSEGFSRGEICYKIQGRKTIFDMLQLLSWKYMTFFFSHLGSKNVWIKLPVPLHHKSLPPTWESDAHDQNKSIKLLGCPFRMAWLNSIVLARTFIYELSQEDSSVMITVINTSLKEQTLCTKKETVRKKPCTGVCELSPLQQYALPS